MVWTAVKIASTESIRSTPRKTKAAKLTEQIIELSEQVAQLTEQVAKLTEQVARLTAIPAAKSTEIAIVPAVDIKPVAPAPVPIKSKLITVERGQKLLYFDGGCKPPNPGQMRFCVTVAAQVPFEHISDQLGLGNSYIAEWRALIMAMRIAVDRQFSNVKICGDSLSVVNQVNGKWIIHKQEHRKLYQEFQQLHRQIPRCTIQFVPRRHNLAGHYLEHH